MNQDIFLVEIAVDAEEQIILKPSASLKEYLLDNSFAGDSRIIQVFPHPKEYMKRRYAGRGDWECECGELHPNKVHRCEKCGYERGRQGGAQPYSKIHQKFGIKPVKQYKDYQK